jgi:hypothetical protein
VRCFKLFIKENTSLIPSYLELFTDYAFITMKASPTFEMKVVCLFIRQHCQADYFSSSPFSSLVKMIPNLLTPWSRVLLEKLIVTHLAKKFFPLYENPRFITIFTKDRYRFLSWSKCTQSTHSHPASLRFIPILSSHLRLGKPIGFFPSGFPERKRPLPYNIFIYWY